MNETSLELPSVAVVLVNYNGARHLPACLDSLAELDYPSDRLEVVLVDNASQDESLELVAARYPWVRVLEQERNLGFAEANNVGAAATDADCVALLNTDMRVEPDWLRRLVAAYDPDAGYRCVAGLVLDWEGERIDFGEGAINYYGFGEQILIGRRLEDAELEDGRELPFACGGSMLIDRRLFLELGGFDPAFFAYFEDVDLGWRVWLSGHRIRFAAGARVRHRHHGTSGGLPLYQRMLLYERNALRTLVKNLDEENFGRNVTAALLLLLERARLAAESPREEYDLGAKATRTSDEVSRLALAPLHAAGDVVAQLDELMEERRRVQAGRRVPDAEIFRRFGRPFKPLGRDDEPYLQAMTRVTHALRLDELFEHRRATTFLIVASEALGERGADAGARSWELARALGRSLPVTLGVPEPVSLEAPGVSIERYGSAEELEQLTRAADVVLLDGEALRRWPFLRGVRALKVVDLYDARLLEDPDDLGSPGDRAVRRGVEVQREALDHGDAFVCASERRRDYWLGVLSARGRIDRAGYEADPTLRMLIDVVPNGCPERPPPPAEPVLKGVHPQIGAEDTLLLWWGGASDWSDPLTVLEAFHGLLDEHPEARLFFPGFEAGGRGAREQHVLGELRARAERLGLLGRQVLLGEAVPYDERGAYLSEADVGVLAGSPLFEPVPALGSRLLDHLWAGLPTVTTGDDEVAELVQREQAGLVVEAGDIEGMRTALARLLTERSLGERMGANAAALAERYRWSRVVEPLARIGREPWRWQALRAARATPVQMTEDAQLLLARWRRERQAAEAAPLSLLPALAAGSHRHGLARSLWSRTPEPLRRRIRPLLGRPNPPPET